MQLEAIVENSYDAIIGETLEGIVTSWNGGARKMLGYSAEEVIGKSVLFMVPAELRDDISAVFQKIKAGEVVADHDSVRLRKDGTRIDVSFSSSPVVKEDGTVIGISCVERDITARKKEEEVLRQIKLIVENSHDAIIGETLDGIVTSWNGGAKKMFGYLPGEMVGKSMTNLFPAELKDELPRLLEKVRSGEIIPDYDSVWLRKDNTRADVEFSISPVKGEDGVIIGASIVGRDITKRKEGERHIKELNETRNKFIAIISHQLRTPLTAVNWNLESILDGDFGKLEETTRKFLQVTHRSSVEITRRIHDLLSAMDIEEGRVRLEKEEVALDSIAAAVTNEMMKKCELKNISCAYIAPKKDIPPIDADSDKVRSAIVKLLENAIGYTKDNGKITVKLEGKDGTVRFEVTDTGVGIPAAEQHHVFTRFFRASNASIMQPDAFGLGLFIAKSFIEQHGGKIGFESREGEGSTFWFEIPVKSVAK